MTRQSGRNGDNRMDGREWLQWILREETEMFERLAAVAGETDARVIAGRKSIAAGDVYRLADAIRQLQGV
jgi:hypothetical protein